MPRCSLLSLHSPLDSIAETPEYEIAHLNLGAETPDSVFLPSDDEHDYWPRSGSTAHTSAPTRFTHPWRPPSFSGRKPRDLKKELVDRDCGIWYVFHHFLNPSWLNIAITISFELSVLPCRTSCCGSIFCSEHISDVRNPFLLY